MYVDVKQSRGDGERCVTSARAAAKETRSLKEMSLNTVVFFFLPLSPRRPHG